MNAGRARILTATLIGLGMLISLSVIPAAGATCALSAPAAVKVGTQLNIVGSGFPGSSSIEISIGLEGATPDQFSVQSDGAGAFTVSLVPEPADAGKTTVLATAGTTCSDQAVITVTGATATPTPVATAPSSASGAGDNAKPPRTDAAPTSVGQTTGVAPVGWTLALLIVLIGVCGALTARRTTGR